MILGTSSQSSHHSSQNHDHHTESRVPRVADDDEVERYMREVQQGVRQEYSKSESESGNNYSN